MTREDLEKFKSTILGWITSAGGGSGPFAPSPHDLNSAHHTGNITDAQHGARTVANAHQHSQIGGVTANQHHNQQHALDGADHTGLLGVSQLPSTVVLESDASATTPSTVSLVAAAIGALLTYARADHRHQLDQSIAPIWTGNHLFQGDLKTRHVQPETGELYDVGLADKRYRTGRFAELAATLFSKEEIIILGDTLIIAKGAGTFDFAMTNAQTTFDFGLTMVVNDWILIKAEDTAGSPATEWIKIGTLVSGTTYNITRNVDGSGANAWTVGTPYVVIGQDGDYRIELEANGAPSISLIRQGSAWNTTTTPLVIDADGIKFIGDNAIDDSSFIKFFSAAMTEYLSFGINNGADSPTITPHASHPLYIGGPGAVGGSRVGLVVLRDGRVVVEQRANMQNSMLEIGDAQIEAHDYSPNTKNVIVRHPDITDLDLPVNHFDPLGALLSHPGIRMVWHGLGHVGNAATGSLLDRTGAGHHLTPNNGPADAQFTSAQFPSINYTDLNGSSHYFDRANEAALSDVNYLDILAVVSFDAIAAGTVKGVYDNGATTPAWRLYADESGGVNRINFETVSSGGVSSYVRVSNISTGPWYVIRAQFITSTLFALTVNSTKATATPAASMRAPVGNFQLGRLGTGSYLDGKFFAGGIAINGAGDVNSKALFQSLRSYFGV